MQGVCRRFDLKLHPQDVRDLMESVWFVNVPEIDRVSFKWRECDIEQDHNIPIGYYELRKQE